MPRVPRSGWRSTARARWSAARLAAALLLPLVLGGCAFLLPRGEVGSEGNWTTFAEAKASYDAVVAGQTGAADLKPLGFDPHIQPNLKSLDYLELIRALVPQATLGVADLPESLQRCVALRDSCLGIQVAVTRRRSERIGFWLLDMLRFRRQTHTTGWDFSATLVLVDGVVVYKTWNGVPEINLFDDEVRPLGPLQEPLDLLRYFL